MTRETATTNARRAALERIDARMRVALSSPEHLKRFLAESGRRWIVFDAAHLVDALGSLGWPQGAHWFQKLVGLYRDHRTRLDPIDEGPCPSCSGSGLAAGKHHTPFDQSDPEIRCATCYGGGRQTCVRSDALEPQELLDLRDWISELTRRA